eukprot:764310-Hanusia_phi.AAC.2
MSGESDEDLSYNLGSDSSDEEDLIRTPNSRRQKTDTQQYIDQQSHRSMLKVQAFLLLIRVQAASSNTAKDVSARREVVQTGKGGEGFPTRKAAWDASISPTSQVSVEFSSHISPTSLALA